MAAEPGPSFRWGVLLRLSKPRRVTLPDGTVRLVEESLDRQDLELIHHIRDNKMGVVVDHYRDVASAWQPGAKRPRYKHALVDLAAGHIDGIACLAVDRLTRRRDQVRPILNAMEEMGGRLFFLWDELDTASDDPDTELRLHELVARAEREAERTSKRYKLAAKHRALQGLHRGSGHRGYGHTKDYRGLVDQEAERLLQAAKAVDGGKAIWTITEEWTQQGIPTAAGGYRWHAKTLQAMLVSPRMIGHTQHEGALIRVEYMPPILPEELWRRVRAKLLDNPRLRGPRESRELTNIALCGICGLPMAAQMDRATPVYLCKKRPSVPGACGGVMVKVSYLDANVNGEIVAFLNDKQRAQALLDAHKLDTPEMAAIDARYAELEEGKRGLERARFNPPQGVKRLPEERYYELLGEIEAEQEQLQRRRVVNRDALPLREALREEWTIGKWEARPIEWRRALVRLMVERIEVSPVTENRGAAKGAHGATHNPDRIKVKLAG